MPSAPAAGGLSRSREFLERAVGQPLPFDDEVLGYLLKVAPVSQHDEVLELVSDFVPRWPDSTKAALVRQLLEVEEPSAPSVPSKSTTSATGRGAASGASRPAARQSDPARDEEADLMLARMLQEEEEAEVALGGQSQARLATKRGKKGYQKMSIDYNIGHGSTPAQLGTAAPSSLADMLRARRQQEQRPLQAQLQSDHFGPPAQRSSWAPSPQDFAGSNTGISWAERAQAAAAAPSPEVAQPTSVQQRLSGMQLKLRTAAGTEYKVNAEGGECVGDVKARLEKMHGIPAGSQRIILLGRELADGQELLAAGLRDGQSLQLAVRDGSSAPRAAAARVGAPPPPPPVTRTSQPAVAQKATSGSEGGELALQLRLPGGVTARVNGLPARATIATLKSRVQQEHGIRADHLALTFFGCPLEEDQHPLADCGVATGATIEVALRPPGSREGAAPPPPATNNAMPSLAAARGSGRGRKGGRGQPEDGDRFASLQTSSHSRVLSEEEALELALAASRQEAAGGGQEEPECGSEGGDVEDSDEDGDAGKSGAAGNTEFHADISLQDQKYAPMVAHAQRVASVQFGQDLVSKVSKRSGLRLTLLAERGKKVKTVLGYTVFKFKRAVMVVMQVGVASEHRGQGYHKQLVRWLVQHAKKASMEMIVLNSPPSSSQLYQQCGFKLRHPAPGEDDEDCMDGQVLLEYRCWRALKTSAPSKARPDFEPPAALARPGARAGSQVAMTRAELARKVFELCDVKGTGILSVKEMERFARLTGFDGASEEWEEEYNSLCQDNGRSPHQGIDVGLLLRLVDDESDKGCYCTDQELREMVGTLEAEAQARRPAPPAPAASPPSDTVAAQRPRSRTDLIHAVFHACDADGDGQLNQQELRGFAAQTGFEGSDAEWEEEYLLLCPRGSGGVDLHRFVELVNDESDNGCHCTDEELRTMLPVLEKQSEALRAASRPAPSPTPVAQANAAAPPELPGMSRQALRAASRPAHSPTPVAQANAAAPPELPGMSRQDLVQAVFHACDRDCDGRLSQAEMSLFATQTGFDGNDEEWEEEFQALCSEHGQDVRTGISAELLARLVDEESDNGCYCSDNELRAMLEALQPPPSAAPMAAAPPAPAPASQPQAAAPKEAENDVRRELVHGIHSCCDLDQDGMLWLTEMRTFAQMTGFPGTDEEWEQEYYSLCADRGVDPDVGFDEEALLALVNDDSDEGQHCTDDELREMLAAATSKQALAAAQPPLQLAAAAPSVPSKPPGLETPTDTPQIGPFPPPMQVPAVPEEDSMPSLATGATASSATPAQDESEIPRLTRVQLVAAVFHACDADGDGRLRCTEMEEFARQTGFDGAAEEWASEFDMLCSDHGVDAGFGIDLRIFAELVDDDSDNGCFCTDGELADMLKRFFAQVKARASSSAGPPAPAVPEVPPGMSAPSDRASLIGEVFRVCDRDCDNILCAAEMRPVAELIGFQGDDAAWAAEFGLLMQNRGGPGISLDYFSQLVNDTSEDGCYCTDDELRILLDRLRPSSRR